MINKTIFENIFNNKIISKNVKIIIEIKESSTIKLSYTVGLLVEYNFRKEHLTVFTTDFSNDVLKTQKKNQADVKKTIIINRMHLKERNIHFRQHRRQLSPSEPSRTPY